MCNKKLTYFGTKEGKDLSLEQKTVVKDYKDRFSKWHLKQIDLLTFSINLVFTISLAVAGFLLTNKDTSLFKDKHFLNNYSLTKTTLCLLTLSATIGIIALITRLNDFRLTKNVVKIRRRIFEVKNDIRYRDSKQSTLLDETKKLAKTKCWASFLGYSTWVLFYFQLVLLGFSIWTIVLCV